MDIIALILILSGLLIGTLAYRWVRVRAGAADRLATTFAGHIYRSRYQTHAEEYPELEKVRRLVASVVRALAEMPPDGRGHSLMPEPFRGETPWAPHGMAEALFCRATELYPPGPESSHREEAATRLHALIGVALTVAAVARPNDAHEIRAAVREVTPAFRRMGYRCRSIALNDALPGVSDPANESEKWESDSWESVIGGDIGQGTVFGLPLDKPDGHDGYTVFRRGLVTPRIQLPAPDSFVARILSRPDRVARFGVFLILGGALIAILT